MCNNVHHLRILLEKYPNEINSTLGDDRETLLHRYVQCFKSSQLFSDTLRKKSQKYSKGF